MTEDEIRVVDNPEAKRYEVHLDGKIVGIATYARRPDRVVFIHTEVDDSVKGRGIGSVLAHGALEDVRQKGLRVTPRCPFFASFIRRNRDYQDLVSWPEEEPRGA